MSFVQNEEVVEALATDGPDDSLHKRILPGRPGGRGHLADPQVVDAPSEGLAVDRVSIPKEVFRAGLLRERRAHLPGRPDCGRVIRHVDVEEFAAIVAEDDEDERAGGR